MLRRTLFWGLVAGTVGLPSAALATRMQMNPDRTQSQRVQIQAQPLSGSLDAHGSGTFGGPTGHVVGPGTAPVDNDSRGPINDVVPGAGTTDTRQNKNPPPLR